MKRTLLNPDRRRFLGCSIKSIAGTSALATLVGLQGVRSCLAAADSSINDHKSLVCIFLFGGNDQWNTLTPYSSAGYARYRRIRGELSLARDALLPLSGGHHGLHPALTGTRELYNEGRLAFVRNIGNLSVPTTREDYFGQRVPLPPHLFSHNHQQEIWQTNDAPVSGVSNPGWGGRIADAVLDKNPSVSLPPSYTLFGNNYWQTGTVERTQIPFDVSPEGVGKFDHFNFGDWPLQESIRSQTWQQILKLDRRNFLERQAASMLLSTNARIDAIRDEISRAPEISVEFDSLNPVAAQLRMVAKLISVREQLGLKRQIFMVGLGSFDTHGNQLAAHAEMLRHLDDGLLSFYRATEELGVSDSVLTFTASEFGRTLTSNGDGTDHAWSSDYLVMGDGVRGGLIHGKPISIYADGRTDSLANGETAYGSRDVGSGRFIPRYSVEQYGATLARWMGLSESELNSVFPRLGNFNSRNLGFLSG